MSNRSLPVSPMTSATMTKTDIVPAPWHASGGMLRGRAQPGEDMERESIECMSKVAGILAQLKHYVNVHVKPTNPDLYVEIRERLADCQTEMAVYCDCAPIMLIAGKVDEIMENHYAIRQQGR